jgi:hypothetical protein
MAGLEKRRNYIAESGHSISCELKGECKLEKQGEYERRVEAVVEQCDDQIEQFKADSEGAGPEQKEKYDGEISLLIANREAVRRGLLRVTPEGDDLCSSCPEEKEAV